MVLALLSGILSSIAGHNTSLRGGLQLVSLVAQIILGIGILKVTLNLVDGKPVAIQQLYENYDRTITYFLVSLLYGFIVAAGLVLFIIPGIFWAIKYQFALYYVVDKNTGIMESFKKSAEATKGQKMDLFLFGLTLIGVNILGVLLFGVGVFVTAPLTSIAAAKVYRTLSTA